MSLIQISDVAYHFFSRSKPSRLNQISAFFNQLSQGLWPHAVDLCRTHFLGCPYVYIIRPARSVYAYVTLFHCVARAEIGARIWGFRASGKEYEAHFPFGGPWFPERVRPHQRLSELNLDHVPIWALSPEILPEWLEGQRWHLIDGSVYLNEQQILINTPPWLPTPWARAKPLAPLQSLVHVITTYLRKDASLPTENTPIVHGIPPLAIDMEPQKIFPLLAQACTDQDALVVGANDPDRPELCGEMRIVTPEQAVERYWETLVLLFPSRQSALTKSMADGSNGPEINYLETLLPLLRRARRMVIIIDQEEDLDHLNGEPSQGLICRGDDLNLLKLTLTGPNTRHEWHQLGLVYDAQGLYGAAEYCFQCTAERAQLRRIERNLHGRKASWIDKAREFEAKGERAEAGKLFERAELWQEALDQWRILGKSEDVIRCRIGLLGQRGEWREVAVMCLRLRQWAAAAEAYERAGLDDRAARLYIERLEDRERSMSLLMSSSSLLAAGKMLERKGWYLEAMVLFQHGGFESQIERLLKRHDERRLEVYYRGNNQWSKLLAHFERKQDLERCLEWFATTGTATSRSAALKLYGLRRYFQAYVRFVVLEEWELAGKTAMRLHRYADAAAAFEKAGNSYEMGIALYKSSDAKVALRMLLDTPRDAPRFTKSARVFAKIADTEWIKDFARELKERKAYIQARWLYAKLKCSVELGEVQLIMGQVNNAFQSWRPIDQHQALDRICDLCLQYGRLIPGVRLVIDVNQCFAQWHKGEITPQKTPKIFELAQTYFSQTQDLTRLRKWARRLRNLDNTGVMAVETFKSFEQLGDWRACLNLLGKWQQTPTAWNALHAAFAAGEHEQAQPESQVLHLYVLNRQHDLQQVLAHLKMTKVNAPLFLLQSSLNLSLSFLVFDKIKRDVVGSGDELCLHLALVARDQGLYRAATTFFLQCGMAEAALECLKKCSEPLEKARLLMIMGRPSEALKIYKRMRAQPHMQMAEALEALGDLEEAAHHYNKAGDGRRARICRLRLQREHKEK